MRPLHAFIAGAFILSAFAGCEKKCTQFNICSVSLSYNSRPTIIGYFAKDVDTQTVIQYKPNGLFDQPVDSFRYINTQVTGGTIYNESDTQELMLVFAGGTNGMPRINDLRLVLPGVRSYSLTEVMADGEFFKEDEFPCSRGSIGCRRRVTSMKIDGVYQDFSDPDTRLILYK